MRLRIAYVALTERGPELGGKRDLLLLDPPRDACELSLPICAVCREPVAELVTWFDSARRVYVYSAWCHGREETIEFSEHTLITIKRGELHVWGQPIGPR